MSTKTAIFKKRRLASVTFIKGGPGSGHFGHAGRPGKVGGSLPGSGEGAAMSVFSGRYARVRQYLTSQGLTKGEISAIISSGAAEPGVGPLDLVGLRGGLLKKAGIAQVQPHIDAYMREGRGRAGIQDLIENLGGERRALYWPRPQDKRVLRLPKSRQLQGQMQMRLNAGKPKTGDMFRMYNPGNGSDYVGVFEVIEVDHEDKEITVLAPNGEVIHYWGRSYDSFTDDFGRDNYGIEKVEAKVGYPFSLEERIKRGRVEVGDKIAERGEEGAYEVVEVDYGGIVGAEVKLRHPSGGEWVYSADDIREGFEPWSEDRIVVKIEWTEFDQSAQNFNQMGREIDPTPDPVIPLRSPLEVSTENLRNMVNGEVQYLDSLSWENDRGISETRIGMLEDGTMVQVKNAGGAGNNYSERLYYELANAVGAQGLVTQATIRRAGSDDGLAIREFVDGKPLIDILNEGDEWDYASKIYEKDFQAMAILDAMAGATDRHSGNLVLKDNGQLVIVDNDYGFNRGEWNFSDVIAETEQYIEDTATHFYDITGDYMEMNSAIVRQMAQYATQATELQRHIDWEDSSGDGLNRFRRRVEGLFKYADWLDRNHGGYKTYP